MSFLDDLTQEDRNVLVSLPYRVGLMVSQSDTTGGNEADDIELQALSNILNGYAQEVFGAETVQYIISETISQKDKWPDWANNLDGVVRDCHRAIDILSEAVDEKEVSAFKQHLIDIGESVAMAFREYENLSFFKKIMLYRDYLKDKKLAIQQKKAIKNWDQFLNISLDERNALRAIAGALNTTYI